MKHQSFILLPKTAITFAAALVLTSGACKKPVEPTNPPASPTALQRTMVYANARFGEINSQMISLEVIAEPGTGSRDSASSDPFWRGGRKAYERVRFLIEQCEPASHAMYTMWFDKNPTSGFHLIEKDLFVTPRTKWDEIETYANRIGLDFSTGSSPGFIYTSINSAGFVTDDAVFHGLKHMLADIDTYKLSGLDAMYSNNSYTDVFSNLEGLDTVYSYYRDSVMAVNPSLDVTFKSRIADMRTALTTAGSLQALDKVAFRATTLPNLQEALKQVAQVFNITL